MTHRRTKSGARLQHSTDHRVFATGAVCAWVRSDPAGVSRFVRWLVTRVRGETEAVAVIVETDVHRKKRESNNVSSFKCTGEPAEPELLTQARRVTGQLTVPNRGLLGCVRLGAVFVRAVNVDVSRAVTMPLT
jgi:hypothetical protein